MLNTTMTSWQVDAISDERMLIERIESFRPDLLILELEMIADLNSVMKVLNIVKPVICALTLEATFAQAKKAIEIGAAELLLKPISPEIILKSVQKFYRQSDERKESKGLIAKNSGEEIKYQELFLNEKDGQRNPFCFGLKTENTNTLPKIYASLEQYKFKKPIFSFILSDMVICFTHHKEIDWKNEWSRFLRDLQESQSEPLAIVILTENIQGDIKQKYSEVRQLMELTFYLGFNQIIHDSTMVHWRFLDPFLSPEEQQLWINLLNEGEIEEIKQWLYREFLEFTLPYPDPGIIRIRLTSILAQIRRYMISYRLVSNPFEEQYLQLFQRILYSPVIYRIIEAFIAFTSRIIEDVKQHQAVKHVNLPERILSYLESNYMNAQLTLEATAQHFQRNASYTSTVISKKYDKSFRVLLNEIRMKQSIKLLKETNLSIKEISTACGFASQQYFNKVFHKYLNLSPTQYRKKSE
ncbi:helix-turn-helix domain-containing protein [Cytobacillus purgationiresistens]|uniref:helix-turn-helix domain-containing protein n=1 Tax=Cytobacillus purgationiresistens TaxID=863449 RepID=UPI0027D8E8A8|nr:helix-turn-helix domain-containing protein [Cytobacillus purgationiresistens]